MELVAKGHKEPARLVWADTPLTYLELDSQKIRVRKDNSGIPLKRCLEAFENLTRDTSTRMKIGQSFVDRFMRGVGKTENFDGSSVLRHFRLRRFLSIPSIILLLQERAVIESSLTELVSLLRSQAWNEKGPLLTNNERNLFFIRDQVGKLAAVHVRAILGFWVLDATTLEDQSKLSIGTRVFVRDPSDSFSEECLVRG